ESLPVAKALAAGDLTAARLSVGRIVGRDTNRLDEAGVIRACVETIAESYVDGVVSVLFWACVGGYFGQAALFAWIFKASNTMDSMVGYDDERYHDFGFAAAKLDDVMNFIPARLGAAAAVAAGAAAGMDYRHAWKIFLRDRLKHKSPNSAHAESVFAGLLGIRLGGGAFYDGQWEPRPFLGDDTRGPEPNDITRAHHILTLSVAVCAVAILIRLRRGW
nr:cobalamin biosynthesis protein [Synergistes sp.]